MSYEYDILHTKHNLEWLRGSIEKIDQILETGVNQNNYKQALKLFKIENWNSLSIILRQADIKHKWEQRTQECDELLKKVNIPAWELREDKLYKKYYQKYDLPDNFVKNSLAEMKKNLPRLQKKFLQLKKQIIEFLPKLNSNMPIWWPIVFPLFAADLQSIEAMHDSLAQDFIFQLKSSNNFFIDMNLFTKNEYWYGYIKGAPLPAEAFLNLVRVDIKEKLKDVLSLCQDFLIYKNIKEKMKVTYAKQQLDILVNLQTIEEFKEFRNILTALPLFKENINPSEGELKSKLEALREFEEKIVAHNDSIFLFFNIVMKKQTAIFERMDEEKFKKGFFKTPKLNWKQEAVAAASYIVTPHSKMLIAKINELLDEKIINIEMDDGEKNLNGNMETRLIW